MPTLFLCLVCFILEFYQTAKSCLDSDASCPLAGLWTSRIWSRSSSPTRSAPRSSRFAAQTIPISFRSGPLRNTPAQCAQGDGGFSDHERNGNSLPFGSHYGAAVQMLMQASILQACQSIYPLKDVFIRKVKTLKAPKFDITKLMEVRTQPFLSPIPRSVIIIVVSDSFFGVPLLKSPPCPRHHSIPTSTFSLREEAVFKRGWLHKKIV